MLEEALEKLDAGERDPAKVLGPIVSIAEGDLPVLNPFQRGVGDGDAEDVATQVVEDLLAAPGVLAVHDPGRRPHRGWHLVEETGAVESRADLCPEDLRQRVHRDQIGPVLRGDPSSAIGGESPGGHEQMDVGVIAQGARPRMEDRETAESSPHIPRITRECEEGRRRALHEEPVHDLLMGSREGPELIRQGKGE
jgi:hypothetical protein